MKLIPLQEKDFPFLYQTLTDNFNRDERRTKEETYRLWKENKVQYYQAIEEDALVGFVSLWSFSQFVYIEHLVVLSSARGRGVGSQILSLLQQNTTKPLLLEIEQPQDEIQTKRLHFYQRNGFVVNQIAYHQPSYQQEGVYLKMLLLSYPHSLEHLTDLEAFLHHQVYGL